MKYKYSQSGTTAACQVNWSYSINHRLILKTDHQFWSFFKSFCDYRFLLVIYTNQLTCLNAIDFYWFMDYIFDAWFWSIRNVLYFCKIRRVKMVWSFKILHVSVLYLSQSWNNNLNRPLMAKLVWKWVYLSLYDALFKATSMIESGQVSKMAAKMAVN